MKVTIQLYRFYCGHSYTSTEKYALLIIDNYKSIANRNNLIFNSIHFLSEKMIFFYGHILNRSEYFAVDSDHNL